MTVIDAIATEAMPYGTFVEVDQGGYARPDATYECRGGVVRRPPGAADQCEEGEKLRIETDGHIQMLAPAGMNVPIELEGGRIKGGPSVVPGLRRR